MPLLYKVPQRRKERIAKLQFKPDQLAHERVGACDLCSGQVFRTIARQDRYGFAAEYQLCEQCGLVFQNPRPTREGYADFYSRFYRPLVSAFKGKPDTPETIQAGQRQYADWLHAFLAPHVRAIANAVDLGGSTGVIARALQNSFGGKWLIVDPAPDEVRVATSLGLEAEVATAESWSPGERKFDLVLICRSIDHCLSVTATLQAARNALTPDGLLFIDIVDFGCLAAVKEDFRKYLKIDHAFYLADETMRGYFAKVGLEVVATDSSVYQFAYLVRRGDTRRVDTGGYAQRSGSLLRERTLAPPPVPYPVDLLTRVAKGVRRRIRV